MKPKSDFNNMLKFQVDKGILHSDELKKMWRSEQIDTIYAKIKKLHELEQDKWPLVYEMVFSSYPDMLNDEDDYAQLLGTNEVWVLSVLIKCRGVLTKPYLMNKTRRKQYMVTQALDRLEELGIVYTYKIKWLQVQVLNLGGLE